ncbi:MAG: phosphoribosyltransferase [Pseudonocardiaceae bacterium]|nr:MAG: phosphoribosyltransferase [Pseudonocardiaceae bacterium]
MSVSPLDVTSGYMTRAHNPREVIDTFRLLRKHHPKPLRFDTLVGTGLSGAIIIPPLARALRKDYLLIRKDDDGTHSEFPAEGRLGSRWLFVDDLVCSGATLRRCMRVVREMLSEHFGHRQRTGFSTELVGMFLYSDGWNSQSARLTEVISTETDDTGFEYVREGAETRERKVREMLCTGCDEGCAGAGCRGERCDHCYDWCGETCGFYQRRCSTEAERHAMTDKWLTATVRPYLDNN